MTCATALQAASHEGTDLTKSVAEPPSGQRRAWVQPLVIASGLFVLVLGLHAADHVRQGVDRLTVEVTLGGQALIVAALAVLVLALRRHPLAPPVAADVGIWSALAVTASHIAPHWSAFSDSYPDNDLDLLAWTSMLAVIATAGMLAVVGRRELRRASEARASAGGARTRH